MKNENSEQSENNMSENRKTYGPVRFPGNITIEDPNDIVMVEGIGYNCIKIYFLNRNSLVVAKSLKFVMDQLDPAVFLRSHNSYIINVSLVTGIEDQGNRLLVHLQGGCQAFVSDANFDAFMRMYKALNKE